MAKESLPQDHPLLQLRERRVGDYTLDVEAWAGRFVGQAEFVLHLRKAGGERSGGPVVEGLYGRSTIPASGTTVERGILDVSLVPLTAFGAEKVPVRGTELERAVVGALVETIADAWSAIMYLAYGWKTLKQIQELGHPLQVTDEGDVLFTHGFRGGWKDYYYSEGWLEGPIKLKAERPPTQEYRVQWDAETAHTLVEFLQRSPADGQFQFHEEGSGEVVLPVLTIERAARARALAMLRGLTLEERKLGDERTRLLKTYPASDRIEGLSRGDLGEVVRSARRGG